MDGMNANAYTVTTRIDRSAGIMATQHEFETVCEAEEFVEFNAELCIALFAKGDMWFRYPIVNGQVQWSEAEECTEESL